MPKCMNDGANSGRDDGSQKTCKIKMCSFLAIFIWRTRVFPVAMHLSYFLYRALPEVEAAALVPILSPSETKTIGHGRLYIFISLVWKAKVNKI